MNLPPPPQLDNPIITQFKPVHGQWELTDENIKRMDPQTGQTILFNYCRYINTTPLEVYRYLIEVKGCDINPQDKNKETPLRNALLYFDPRSGDDITALTYLINQKRVNGNIKGMFGNTLLHYACQNINGLPIDVFKFLIETVGFDVNVQNKDNDTPLHYAFGCFDPDSGGTITALTYLLNQKGINGNIKGYNGCTLLHTACENMNYLPIDVFKLLIETVGFDVNVQDNNNDTPIHRALREFNPDDDINVLYYLLNQKGVNANIKGGYGNTLLHYACENINHLPLDIFKLLVEKYGGDVNVQDDDQNTPLQNALRCFKQYHRGDINVLYYLFNQKDVNVNMKDPYGFTLFHRACEKINSLTLEIFKLLIEVLGADVNVKNNDYLTPIHTALSKFSPNKGGDITALTYLLNQKGINGNIKILLHIACANINDLPLDVFKILIETHGANVENNSLHLALRYFKPNEGGDIKALAYLIDQKNVNIGIKGNMGQNLLHLACISNLQSYDRSVALDAQFDSNLCQIVEIIAERCVEQVLDERTS
jgi:ankyrin repeat protein